MSLSKAKIQTCHEHPLSFILSFFRSFSQSLFVSRSALQQMVSSRFGGLAAVTIHKVALQAYSLSDGVNTRGSHVFLAIVL